jgi:YidC/Oxa1 family membrane protein insertase
VFENIKKSYLKWSNFRAIKRVLKEKPRLVFYSEGISNWVHFEHIIRYLCENLNEEVVYISSDEQEARYLSTFNGIISFYIGEGNFRTVLFASLSTPVFIMTMPDLNNYHIKRSWNNVHYVYIHHSMVSTHMIYQPAAFDHFDTIFCVGEHHLKEIRAREVMKDLKVKTLISHGYGRLDQLIKKEAISKLPNPGEQHPLHILIAPSWGENSLLNRHGGEFIHALLNEGFTVTLRPHPQTRRFSSEKLDRIEKQLKGSSNFVIEEKMDSMESLLSSDVMISDWSGAALEFAFSRLKPVLFVDVPRKINNSEYEILDIEPLEVFIRDEIGLILSEEQLPSIVDYVQQLIKLQSFYSERIKKLRESYVFNIGDSGKVGAMALYKMLNENSKLRN